MLCQSNQMETDLLQGCLFSRLSETKSLFPWFGHHSVCSGSGSGIGEHGLRVTGRVGRILTAAPLHPSIHSIHLGSLFFAGSVHVLSQLELV